MFYSDRQMQDYFDTLPKSVQESIVQSGAKAMNVEQLKKLVQEIKGENTSG